MVEDKIKELSKTYENNEEMIMSKLKEELKDICEITEVYDKNNLL